MTLSYIGIGTNLGPRWTEIDQAGRALAVLGTWLRLSPIYQSAPVGGPLDQGPYLNAVAELETGLEVHQLLAELQRIEHEAGRVRIEHWGPRTLDLDILLFGEVKLDEELLKVPHPRLYERAFVLSPLEDLGADLVPPNWRDLWGGAQQVLSEVRRVGELLRSPDALTTGTPG